jgi:hypothetical protein
VRYTTVVRATPSAFNVSGRLLDAITSVDGFVGRISSTIRDLSILNVFQPIVGGHNIRLHVDNLAEVLGLQQV